MVRILFSFLVVFNLFGFYPTWNELQDLRPVAVTFYWLCEKQYITGCVKVDVTLISRSQPCKFIPVNFVSKGAKDIVCLVCMWFCLLWKLRYFLETKYVNVFRKRSFFSVCYQIVFYWVYWNILDSYLSFVNLDSLCLWTHSYMYSNCSRKSHLGITSSMSHSMNKGCLDIIQGTKKTRLWDCRLGRLWLQWTSP